MSVGKETLLLFKCHQIYKWTVPCLSTQGLSSIIYNYDPTAYLVSFFVDFQRAI